MTRAQLRSDKYRHLMRGVVVPADERVTLRTWVEAARLVAGPDSVASGRTALQLRGLDFGPMLPIKVATPRRVRCKRPQMMVLCRSGLNTSGPVQSVRDAVLAELSGLPLKDAVALCDRVLFRGMATASDMMQWLADARGRAADALTLARTGAESIPETHLRLCIGLSGLPMPATQVEIRDGRGFVGRFDLGIEEFGILLEYEGDYHRVDEEQWDRDLGRVQRAQAMGLLVVRVTAQMMREPWSVVENVYAQLRLRAYRGPTPRQTPRWLACFARGRAAAGSAGGW